MTEEKFAELTVEIWRAMQHVQKLMEQYQPVDHQWLGMSALVFDNDEQLTAFAQACDALRASIARLTPDKGVAFFLTKTNVLKLLAA
jgi:hypothetical protein